MGREKEIIIDEKELAKLLQGSLHWNDIAPRIDGQPRRSGIRQLKDPLPPHEFKPEKKDDIKDNVQQSAYAEKRPPLQWKNLNAQELTYRKVNWESERQKEESEVSVSDDLRNNAGEETSEAEKIIPAQLAQLVRSVRAEEQKTKSKAELLERMFSETAEDDEEYAEAGATDAPKTWQGKSVVVFVSSLSLFTLSLWCYYLFA